MKCSNLYFQHKDKEIKRKIDNWIKRSKEKLTIEKNKTIHMEERNTNETMVKLQKQSERKEER
jgi:hypothetical protein